MHKESNVMELPDHDAILESMARSVKDHNFMNWKPGPSKVSKPDQQAKEEYLKITHEARTELSHQIDLGKAMLLKVQKDQTGIFTDKFTKGFMKAITKLEQCLEQLCKKLSKAEEANPKLFKLGKAFGDPRAIFEPALSKFQIEYHGVAKKQFK